MAPVKSFTGIVVTCAVFCILCHLITVNAESNVNFTHSPAVALAESAAEIDLGEGGGQTLDGDLELETANDAAMLQWAIGHADPLKMRQMATEARGWNREKLEAKNAELQQLLETVRPPSDFQQELLDVASNGSEPSSRRAAALDALQEVVEAIDNARDLHKAGGIPTVVKLLTDDDVNVRRGAAWVVGAAVQNNPEVQEQFLYTTCLPSLLTMVQSSDSGEATKALYAVSALVRGQTKGLTGFCEHGGPALFGQIILDASADPRLQKKALALLGDLAKFRDGLPSSGDPPLATLEVMRAMLGFLSAGDVDMREKVTHALLPLLDDNVQTLEFLNESGKVLEIVVRIEGRLEAMRERVNEGSGSVGEEWQLWHLREMAEVIEQVEEAVNLNAQLRPRKVDRIKDEL